MLRNSNHKSQMMSVKLKVTDYISATAIVAYSGVDLYVFRFKLHLPMGENAMKLLLIAKFSKCK